MQCPRELIRNALTSLILEKGYEHVTVQDICDRADVGRSTFYEHLRDKEELLLSGFDDLYDELRQAFADHEQQTASRNAKPGSWAALVVIEQIANYRAVSSMLCSRASTVASARLRRILSELLHDHLRVQLDPTASTRVPIDVAIEDAVASLLGLIHRWLEHDRPYWPGHWRRCTGASQSPGSAKHCAPPDLSLRARRNKSAQPCPRDDAEPPVQPRLLTRTSTRLHSPLEGARGQGRLHPRERVGLLSPSLSG